MITTRYQETTHTAYRPEKSLLEDTILTVVPSTSYEWPGDKIFPPAVSGFYFRKQHF